MQKIAFFRVSHCIHIHFLEVFWHTQRWQLNSLKPTNTLTRASERSFKGEARLTAQLPGWGAASPSKEQDCQTLVDLRLSNCPEPSERSQCILRLPHKQIPESLGVIIFPTLGWSFAAYQHLDLPDLPLFACWLPEQTSARLPGLLLLWLFIINHS